MMVNGEVCYGAVNVRGGEGAAVMLGYYSKW